MANDVVIPHADRVITPSEDAECRYCGTDLQNQAHYLGTGHQPTDHVGWECDNCGFLVAELIESDA